MRPVVVCYLVCEYAGWAAGVWPGGPTAVVLPTAHGRELSWVPRKGDWGAVALYPGNRPVTVNISNPPLGVAVNSRGDPEAYPLT
jgi:hypothetical protein